MNKKLLYYLGDIIALIVLIWLDQLSKSIVLNKLAFGPPVVLIDNVFELHYLENRGAAFGMLQNGKVFFIFAAIVMLAMISYVLYKAPAQKKYLSWHIFMILICAGGIGNMIDRIRLSYVVDFLYFKLIDFPIFNVADIYVTIGTILLVVFLVFIYKEEDLAFLSFRSKNNSEKNIE